MLFWIFMKIGGWENLQNLNLILSCTQFRESVKNLENNPEKVWESRTPRSEETWKPWRNPHKQPAKFNLSTVNHYNFISQSSSHFEKFKINSVNFAFSLIEISIQDITSFIKIFSSCFFFLLLLLRGGLKKWSKQKPINREWEYLKKL